MPYAKGESRVVSLSQDWNKILNEDCKFQRSSRFRRYITKDVPETGTEGRPKKEFCSGSSYEGQWDQLGMSGLGRYQFPDGVVYEGQLKDGMFDGNGTMTFPAGSKIDGRWVKGKLVSYKYIFADGLEYSSSWDYCKMPDRRFYVDIQEGLQPATKEFLTNEQPTREMPDECYDTGDGFYHPKSLCVISHLKDITKPLTSYKIERVPKTSEQQWIKTHCRKAWDQPVGHKPELYEYYFSGRHAEFEEIEEKLINDNISEDDSLVSGIDSNQNVVPSKDIKI